MSQRILVTGPIGSMEDWISAAAGGGWEPTAWPLISVRVLEVDLVELIDGLPGHICVTSKSALHSLEAACQQLPELRTVPAAVVGNRTAASLESIGLHPRIVREEGARELADALLEELGEDAPGHRVLWPRGSISNELAILLREAGLVVDDPIVYQTEPCTHEEPAPDAEAVFFASPSAVRAWSGSTPVPLAIAIGATTRAALVEAGEDRFPLVEMLETPRPASLTSLLEGRSSRVDPERQPG